MANVQRLCFAEACHVLARCPMTTAQLFLHAPPGTKKAGGGTPQNQKKKAPLPKTTKKAPFLVLAASSLGRRAGNGRRGGHNSSSGTGRSPRGHRAAPRPRGIGAAPHRVRGLGTGAEPGRKHRPGNPPHPICCQTLCQPPVFLGVLCVCCLFFFNVRALLPG